MKRLVCLLLFLCMLFAAACSRVDIPPVSDPVTETTGETSGTIGETAETIEETTETIQETTEYIPETTEYTPETTEYIPETTEYIPETTEYIPETNAFDSYVVRISRSDFPIYASAGYSGGVCGYVEKAGSYTIVEEAEDEWGNLWGRLKSGAGWINLTQLDQEEAVREVLSVVRITDAILNSGDYRLCHIAFDPYVQQILVRANRNLTDIEIFPLSHLDPQLAQAPKYNLDRWDQGELLLIEASFPGYFSSYAIRVTDEEGVIYHYRIVENFSGVGEPFYITFFDP